jgi:hypothetical protein
VVAVVPQDVQVDIMNVDLVAVDVVRLIIIVVVFLIVDVQHVRKIQELELVVLLFLQWVAVEELEELVMGHKEMEPMAAAELLARLVLEQVVLVVLVVDMVILEQMDPLVQMEILHLLPP